MSRLGLDPLPFPVRSERASSVFASSSVSVDGLLDELDQFLAGHQDLIETYGANAARLAMICATRHVSRGDFSAALASLGAGLRADPENHGLKVHQALALQAKGHPGAAAAEYEQLLWNAPQAFDPLIRALAAKAFSANGEHQKARDTIEYEHLPKHVFQDPSLRKLRDSLRSRATPPLHNQAQATTKKAQAPTKPSQSGERRCANCGHALRPGAKFCGGCGKRL